MNNVEQRYNFLISEGKLDPDPAQEQAIQGLAALEDQLSAWSAGRKNALFSFFSRKPSALPRGLYLWGGVGRGKSLLMDLFYNNSRFPSKKRVHFHEFMIDIHARIDHWRKLSHKDRQKHPHFNKADGDDPIAPVARMIAKEARLLCFDEFQVADIADAMILGRLFSNMFEIGVVVVATSNRHPTDLYLDGLNRQLFLPFIALFQDQLDILQLEAARDYRLERLSGAPVYHTPLGPEATHAMDTAWESLMAGATPKPKTMTVNGRVLTVPAAARGAGRASFAQLCETPLGAADYLEIARCFSTFFIDDIPAMGPTERNEAKRFVTLIDAIYECCGKLVCSADAEPSQLYRAGDGSFEFERTASRLMEMQSEDYLACAHCPEAAKTRD